MASGEEHGDEHQGEQKGGGEAFSLNNEDDPEVQNGGGSSAGPHEDKLGEGWPQIELDRGRGFVVCTIDTQLLSGGFFACSQGSLYSMAMKRLFGRMVQKSSLGSSACVSPLSRRAVPGCLNFLLGMERRRLLVAYVVGTLYS